MVISVLAVESHLNFGVGSEQGGHDFVHCFRLQVFEDQGVSLTRLGGGCAAARRRWEIGRVQRDRGASMSVDDIGSGFYAVVCDGEVIGIQQEIEIRAGIVGERGRRLLGREDIVSSISEMVAFVKV